MHCIQRFYWRAVICCYVEKAQLILKHCCLLDRDFCSLKNAFSYVDVKFIRGGGRIFERGVRVPMASAGARAPAGVQGAQPLVGAEGPEADSFYTFGGVAKLAPFMCLGENCKKAFS